MEQTFRHSGQECAFSFSARLIFLGIYFCEERWKIIICTIFWSINLKMNLGHAYLLVLCTYGILFFSENPSILLTLKLLCLNNLHLRTYVQSVCWIVASRTFILLSPSGPSSVLRQIATLPWHMLSRRWVPLNNMYGLISQFCMYNCIYMNAKIRTNPKNGYEIKKNFHPINPFSPGDVFNRACIAWPSMTWFTQ